MDGLRKAWHSAFQALSPKEKRGSGLRGVAEDGPQLLQHLPEPQVLAKANAGDPLALQELGSAMLVVLKSMGWTPQPATVCAADASVRV